MKIFYLLLSQLIIISVLAGQQVATFESLVNGPDEVYNGSESPTNSAVFLDGGVALRASFQTFPGGFTSWGDFAISSVVDTQTPGFENQYASITGGGAEGSTAYAVSFGSGARMYLTQEAIGQPVTGMYLTNTTYTYFTIRDGNDFSDAFGGETGNDPDYFLLTIKGYRNGQLTTDSIDFVLADYRFEDNTQDYIVDSWEYVDLTPLGAIDSLEFSYFSTDSNNFGPLTPTYFCVDNIQTNGPSVGRVVDSRPDLEIYPNPASKELFLSSTDGLNGQFRIVDTFGRTIQWGATDGAIDLGHLASGQYVLLLESKQGLLVRRFVRK